MSSRTKLASIIEDRSKATKGNGNSTNATCSGHRYIICFAGSLESGFPHGMGEFMTAL